MTFISSTKLAEWVNDRADAGLPSTSQPSVGRKTREILPGLFLNWVIAGAAFAIRRLFSPMILSVGVGIALHNVVRTVALAKRGVISRWLLRIACFQLVLQLASGPDIGIGGGGLGIIAATVRVCFAFTIWIGALVRVQLKLAQLIAAGTSICSASAVMATNIVANTHDEDFANAIACVIVLSVTMFA